MCVRCNKTAGTSLASVCQKCKITGKCAICKQAEEGLGPENNTPDVDVEAAIEHENEKLGFLYFEFKFCLQSLNWGGYAMNVQGLEMNAITVVVEQNEKLSIIIIFKI